EEKSIPATTGIISTVAQHSTPPAQDGLMVSDVQETEVKGSDEGVELPEPLNVDTTPTEHISHGPRSAEVVTSADIVQETLSHPPRDEDLTITSPGEKQKDMVNEPEKVEEKADEVSLKGV